MVCIIPASRKSEEFWIRPNLSTVEFHKIRPYSLGTIIAFRSEFVCKKGLDAIIGPWLRPQPVTNSVGHAHCNAWTPHFFDTGSIGLIVTFWSKFRCKKGSHRRIIWIWSILHRNLYWNQIIRRGLKKGPQGRCMADAIGHPQYCSRFWYYMVNA